MTGEARICGPLPSSICDCRLPTRRAAVGIGDERSREREQTDCEHDERAVQ
jgi:hypothetical protein